LFERFKWRFIFAPLFLLVTCIAFFWWDLNGIVLATFIWGVWHGMMQTYGFCRIYDAKVGSFAEITRRLDFALCGIWFATAVLLSPQRMADTLAMYYSAGGPFIPPAVLRAGQQGFFALALLISAVFLANFIWMWSSGKRPSPVKLLLLITSISFWWYCNNIVASVLVGIALFEVFHDVQYLSLVWIYNRNRVEKDSNIGGFMRFVFRRSGSLVGLYVGLVFAYGSLSFINAHLGIDTVKRILTGVVTTSTLLHFYYDGFIWKVREKSTRQSLGIAGGTVNVSLGGFLPGWALHGAKWVAVFVIPLGMLWFAEVHSGRNNLDRLASIVADLPRSAPAHFNYATKLQEARRTDEAAKEYSEALRLNPDSVKAHVNLAIVLSEQGKADQAIDHYRRAVALRPDYAEAHYNLGRLLVDVGQLDDAVAHYEKAVAINPADAKAQNNLGVTLFGMGRGDDAIAHYRKALEIRPDYAEASCNLASALIAKGDLDGAIARYTACLAAVPDQEEAQYNLASALLRKGRVDEAIIQFQKVLAMHPESADAHANLASTWLAKGRVRDAMAEYTSALRISPENLAALSNMAWLLATSADSSLRNGSDAVRFAERADSASSRSDTHPTILRILAAAYAEAGRFDDAKETAQHALEAANIQGNTTLADALQGELALYDLGLPYHK